MSVGGFCLFVLVGTRAFLQYFEIDIEKVMFKLVWFGLVPPSLKLFAFSQDSNGSGKTSFFFVHQFHFRPHLIKFVCYHWFCTDKVDSRVSRGNETVVPGSSVSCLHASEFVNFLRSHVITEVVVCRLKATANLRHTK